MNRIRVSQLLFCIFFVTAHARLCFAQTSIALVRGLLESSSPIQRDMIVELYDYDRHMMAGRNHVARDGTFEFQGIAPGPYLLRVKTLHGEEITERQVSLHAFGGELRVRLPEQAAARPVTGPVSMRELRSPPPRKALQALLAAERSAEKGHPDDAIRQLRKALEIHPSLVEAHTNLGVQYCKAEQYERGVEQFQLAPHYGSDSAQLQTNLAYGLLGLKHFREAEQAGRRAVKLDGSYVRGHYVLGHVLGVYARFAVDKSARGAYKAEALQHLRISAEEIPAANQLIRALE